MAVLVIILLATIGLAVRAGIYGRGRRLADSETREDASLRQHLWLREDSWLQDDSWLIDTCARSFTLVLLSLLGLLALGIMYGNVLGVQASR